jgi:hypothetical protein
MRSLRDTEAGEELTVPYYHPTHLVSLRHGDCSQMDLGFLQWSDVLA